MSRTDLSGVYVTALEQRKDGWHAVVEQHGRLRDVDRSQGSWRYTPAKVTGGWIECGSYVAHVLQLAVRTVERRERRHAQAVDG